jgi:nucleoside-diphosphate-sugar epimerase
MKKVLVTGATGCVGRHAIASLAAAGWDVHGVSSRAAALPETPGVTWHRANLLTHGQAEDVLARVEPTHLLHLAWYIAPGRWASAPENFDWVCASLELLRAFKAHGGRRIVAAGSCLEYDWHGHDGICSEDRTPLTPHTVYGTCKHALDQLTTAFAASQEMTTAWGRIFFLYGPHEHPDRLVASVVRSLLGGRPARCSHGNQVRDYLFVQDVADAFVELMDSTFAGDVNIASGRPITLKTIVERIGALMGRSDLIRLGAIPAAPTDAPVVVADVKRLHASLSWRPRFDLDEGLRRTIAWWSAQPALRRDTAAAEA